MTGHRPPLTSLSDIIAAVLYRQASERFALVPATPRLRPFVDEIEMRQTVVVKRALLMAGTSIRVHLLSLYDTRAASAGLRQPFRRDWDTELCWRGAHLYH